MPKPRIYGPKILEVNKEPLTSPEITKKLKTDRRIVGRNLKWAEKKNLIHPVLGKYHLTPLGKYHLTPHGKVDAGSPPVLTDSISFEVSSQIIDSLKIREDKP